MLIAIDGNEANVKNRVGSNRFAFEVIWHFFKLKSQNAKGKSTTKSLNLDEVNFLVFLENLPSKDLPPETEWWQYEVFGPKKFWTWTGLVKRLYLGRPRPDVLFSPSHYGPGFSPIPFVVSIMDLGFLRWPQQFTKKDFYQLKYWTAWSVKRAKKIIAISEFTKEDIVNTYRVDPSKVVVAYPGFRKTQNLKLKSQSYKLKIKNLKRKYGIGGDYILYLGTLKPSKNIEGLIRAYKVLTTGHRPPVTNLVIAGKKGWLYQDIFRLVKELKLEDQAIFTGFVSDKEAEILMRGAKVFALPSFWEGFGIPVLEAMDAGVPVVCSDRGSLPEVVEKAAIIVDPEKPEKIAEGINKVLSNPSIAKKLVRLGKERAKLFSWQKCSKIILDNLISIEKNRKG